MQHFQFYNPTRIVFGEAQIQRLNELVPTDAKVMVLFGGGSVKTTGTLDEVKQALGERQVIEFGGIEPNPVYDTLLKAVEQVRQEQVDFLLAVGGGSVIDGTKFVAAAADFQGDPWEVLTASGQNIDQAMPFGSVLTLPATGSEMNNGAVINNTALQAKLPFSSPLIYPAFSILDPSKGVTLPAHQLSNGIVDAFTHVMEQYLTYPAGARIQDRFAEGLLQTLTEIGPQLLKDPQNIELQSNLMWVATLALNGLIGAGVPQDWSTHMVGHELTALYGIDHAQTLAIVLPGMLHVRRDAKAQKLLQYGERVWNIREGSEAERIEAAINATREFFESLSVATRMPDYGLNESDIDRIINHLETHGMTALGENQDVTPTISRQALQASL